jgi:hypothetical protein
MAAKLAKVASPVQGGGTHSRQTGELPLHCWRGCAQNRSGDRAKWAGKLSDTARPGGRRAVREFPYKPASKGRPRPSVVSARKRAGCKLHGRSPFPHRSDLSRSNPSPPLSFSRSPSSVTACSGDLIGWLGSGTKWYIGNANAAGLISIMARDRTANPDAAGKRASFVFFALCPHEKGQFAVRETPDEGRNPTRNGRNSPEGKLVAGAVPIR